MSRHRPHWTPDAVVYSLAQMRGWINAARQGERCLYHVGMIASDSEASQTVRDISAHVQLMGELGIVAPTQRRMDEGFYQYYAARTGLSITALPQSLASGAVDALTWIALRALRERNPHHRLSAHRTIKLAIGNNEAEARAVLNSLISSNMLTPDRPPALTPAGLRALQ